MNILTKIMRKKICLLVLLISSYTVVGQNLNKIEKQIKRLTGDAIKQEWEAIINLDQAIRERQEYSAKQDIINCYKVVLMEHYHGYPTNKYGYPAYTTPWVVGVHCPSAAMAQYMFPIILKGRDLQQLPEDRFPDYFVGGLLLKIYGLDMVYDMDFHTNGFSPITRFTYRLEEERHEIDLKEMKKLTKEALAIEKHTPKNEIGKWSIIQHETTSTYSIAQYKHDYYLKINDSYRKLKPKDKNLDYFDFVEGYGHYHLVISNGRLLMQDPRNNTIKTLEPIKG